MSQEPLMNERQKDEFLRPIIDKLKQDFKGSDDYHSGVNDGMYKLGKLLIDEVNETCLKQMMTMVHTNNYPVEALPKSSFLSLWALIKLKFNK